MDPEQIIGQLLGGFVGRKRRRGGLLNLALGGGRGGGLLTGGTLLTAAGLVWGAIESMQGSGPGAAVPGDRRTSPTATPPSPTATPGTGAAATSRASMTGVSGTAPPLVPPPIPGATPSPDAPDVPVPPALLPLVQLAVSAARADGELSEEETVLIRARAHDLGAQALVDAELGARRPLEIITPAFTTTEQRQLVYALAFGIVHGEGDVSPGERMYLTQLSRLLSLSDDEVAKIEQAPLAQE